MIIDRALLESVLNEEHISEGVEVKGKDHYEFANGKRPSGRGHWMFGLGPKSNHEMQMVRSNITKCSNTMGCSPMPKLRLVKQHGLRVIPKYMFCLKTEHV